MSKTERLVGAHVSTSGGLHQAVIKGAEMGANCIQIFSASPRMWRKPSLDKFDVKALHQAQADLGVKPIVTHALYLLNLASDNPEQVKKSIDALIFELKFDSLIKGGGVVVHLGSHQGRGWEAVKELVLKGIVEVLEKTPKDSLFLMENSAGQNGKIGSDLAELKWLADQVKSPRLGWCVDTCHLHCAGFNLDPDAANSAASRITELDMWSRLKVVHVNDARDPFDSHKDRHANLGDGTIPTQSMRKFLNLQQLEALPMYLEVPGLDGNGPDAENISRLKALVS